MSRQIRISISDRAHGVLVKAATEHECTQGEIVTSAILRMLEPESEVPVDVSSVEGQCLRIMAMLQHLMEAQGCWPMPEAQGSSGPSQEEPNREPEHLFSGTYDPMAFYRHLPNGEAMRAQSLDEIEPGFASEEPPKRSGLRRLFFKG